MTLHNKNHDSGPHPSYRVCGICGEQAVPVGVDWPWWSKGSPVCVGCQAKTRAALINNHGSGGDKDSLLREEEDK